MPTPFGAHDFERGNHRLHDDMQQLAVMLGCLSVTMFHYLLPDREIPDGIDIHHVCKLYDCNVVIPTLQPAKKAIKGIESLGIGIEIVPKQVKDYDKPLAQTEGLRTASAYIFRHVFSNYYERNVPWVRDNIAGHADAWPPVWDFARVVRNACSHGGAIYIPSPNTRSVSWMGLAIGPNDHGQPLFGGRMEDADLAPLMVELDQTLDQAGCLV